MTTIEWALFFTGMLSGAGLMNAWWMWQTGKLLDGPPKTRRGKP